MAHQAAEESDGQGLAKAEESAAQVLAGAVKLEPHRFAGWEIMDEFDGLGCGQRCQCPLHGHR